MKFRKKLILILFIIALCGFVKNYCLYIQKLKAVMRVCIFNYKTYRLLTIRLREVEKKVEFFEYLLGSGKKEG